jgi:hypothetical protein
MSSQVGNLKAAMDEAYWRAQSRKLEEKYGFNTSDPSFLKEEQELFAKQMDSSDPEIRTITIRFMQQIAQLSFDMGFSSFQVLPYVDYDTMKAVPDNFNFLKLAANLRKMYKALDQPTQEMMQTMFGNNISGISAVPTVKGEIRMLIDFLDQHGEIYVVAN